MQPDTDVHGQSDTMAHAADAGAIAFAGVSCGGEHTLFLDELGRVTSTGACGLGWVGDMPGAMDAATLTQRSVPCAVKLFLGVAAFSSAGAPSLTAALAMPRAAAVVGGYYHSLVISASGRLFTWGCGNFGGTNDGQLGNGPLLRDVTEPGEVVAPGLLEGETFVDAAAGCYHSVALTSARRVLTFGLNNFGQLGREMVPPGNDRVPREAGEPNYSDGVPRQVAGPVANPRCHHQPHRTATLSVLIACDPRILGPLREISPA